MESSRQRFEEVNQITEEEVLYSYDEDAEDLLREQAPWRNDPSYFKRVKISAVALIKMVMHAQSGGNIEVMGLLQGKVIGNDFVVLDTFALPVEGTETRVNAGEQAINYMINYTTSAEVVGRKEKVCGWYHSHPGYGCWLSGIDVRTEQIHQQVEDPYVAIVIDPIRTISSGKVEIGCFRTYPEGYNPPDVESSGYQHIPLEKIEDFGVHYKCYYTLEHSFFKSSMDSYILNLLWNKYWAQTLSSSSLLTNRDYATSAIADLSEKVEQMESNQNKLKSMMKVKKEGETAGMKVAQDAAKVGSQQGQGLVNLLLKNLLFNQANI